MQKDLHHVGTYVICRLAGMKSKYAKIVAYAAQQVDDATHGHVLRFTNGEIFRQTMTAHKAISPINFNVNASLEVWVPFHFLPQGKDHKGNDGLVTGTESPSLRLLKEELKDIGKSSLALYRLGIGLHCYADTFTHQDFKGFYDRYNDITLLSIKKVMNDFTLKEKFLRYIKFYIGKIASKILPCVGHGQAVTCPDIPYLRWSYKRAKASQIDVDNLNQRFIVALRSIYDFIFEYLEVNPQFKGNVKVKDFEVFQYKFLEIMAREGSSDERYEFWLRKVHNNYFIFEDFDEIDANLTYDSREWFNEAVEVVRKTKWWPKWFFKNWKYSFHRFKKKDNFVNSHWVMYMRAAVEHRYNVIHYILPQCGVDVG